MKNKYNYIANKKIRIIVQYSTKTCETSQSPIINYTKICNINIHNMIFYIFNTTLKLMIFKYWSLIYLKKNWEIFINIIPFISAEKTNFNTGCDSKIS